MKQGLSILSCVAALGCLWALSACDKKNEETPVAFEFSVTAPGGADISAVRQFTYGEKADYSFTAKGLKGIDAAAPQGWTVSSSVGSKTISVTAPGPKYFGGLVASIWDNTKGSMTKCSNEGPIKFNFGSVITNGMQAGGVIGTCAGAITNTACMQSVQAETRRVGGFAGGIWNEGLLENCYNKGKVICTTKRVAAAFAVVGDKVVLKNCSNEGEIKCGTVDGAQGKAWSPLVAGLCAISGEGATVNYIPKDQWNNNTILSWLQ